MESRDWVSVILSLWTCSANLARSAHLTKRKTPVKGRLFRVGQKDLNVGAFKGVTTIPPVRVRTRSGSSRTSWRFVSNQMDLISVYRGYPGCRSGYQIENTWCTSRSGFLEKGHMYVRKLNRLCYSEREIF